jgi:hypothetical protein
VEATECHRDEQKTTSLEGESKEEKGGLHLDTAERPRSKSSNSAGYTGRAAKADKSGEETPERKTLILPPENVWHEGNKRL